MRQQFLDWIELPAILLSVLVKNLDLLVFALPRALRGGYRSPWVAKESMS